MNAASGRHGLGRAAWGGGLLAAAAFAPLVPGFAGGLLFALVATTALVILRPERSVLVLALGAVLLAAGLRLFSVQSEARGGDLEAPAAEPVRRALADAAEQLWQELEAQAEAAAAQLPADPESPGVLLETFRRLGEMAEERDGTTFLLLDDDGEAQAWAGEGLLHEPRASSLSQPGRHFEAGFGAVSWFVVRPVPWGDETRQLVAGRSVPNDRWPFPAPVGAPKVVRWSLVEPTEPLPAETSRLAPTGSGPALAVATVPLPEVFPRSVPPSRATGVAWWVFALGAAAVAATAGRRRRSEERRHALTMALAAGGTALAALALAKGAQVPVVAMFVVSVAVLVAGLLRGEPVGVRPWRLGGVLAFGAGVSAIAVGMARYFARLGPGADLGADFVVDATGVVLRGTLLLFVAGGLLSLGAVAPLARIRGRDGWFWLAAALALAAGVAADGPVAQPSLLLAAGAAAALGRPGRRLTAASGLGLATVSALIAAAAYEGAYRGRLEERIAREFLPQLARSEPAAREEIRDAMQRFLQDLDLAHVSPRDPDATEPQDLAFSLWRRSPLVRANSSSALEVVPDHGRPSRFSFGFDPWAEVVPLAADEPPTPALAGAPPVVGEEALRYDGTPWAVVRYWIVPRPGFSLNLPLRVEAAEIGLLGGRPGAHRQPAGLPPTVAYALFDRDGRVLDAPWHEMPPLSPSLALGGAERVGTPVGPARAWSWFEGDRVTVLYLPLLTVARGLERVGTHAAGSLAAVGWVALLALVVALPRQGVRRFLAQATRSYSKRMIVVFTGLVLLPLLLLSLVILKSSENRLLRAQRVTGENALAAAQRILEDQLADAGPGISIAAVIDNSILHWLSSVLGQDVTLYWGSSLYASSKPELFATGLLPRRIPGEIYAGLSLLGTEAGVRTARAGDTTYLELYAPLRFPGGESSEQGKLALSMPLLAQQAEVQAELAASRRQTLLVSAALFGLIVAIGTSFARRFSGPLEDLVAGTRRIAAGATSLERPPPAELELEALATAIDDMAGKIADSRNRLEREKAVVLRMVENITSGVVSLDREHRVLLHNRVAQELLGTAVGEPIGDALAKAERLAPIAAFLVASAGGVPRRSTVRLAGPEGAGEREWSLVWVPVPGSGEPAALLVVEDATEILRGQRLAAWAEMARIIAHEIKNPLTPIRLSTEHLRQVYQQDRDGFDRVFDRCTANILREVEELRQIAMEFSTYSSIPRIEPQPADLVAAVEAITEGYRTSHAASVEVVFHAAVRPLEVRFDARMLGRSVRNLIENSLRVSPPGGRVEVRVTPDADGAAIAVVDQGPGVSPELLPRIFDPYFSTHDAGTGLGLPIARRIAEEHGGTVVARNRTGGGLEVTIRIPSSC
ncbi:MAG: ATP-binding protein [Thermoanaerobaculia bacterium]|nr:ATP-binding protein [Thermoanaerobaculia bacterium]